MYFPRFFHPRSIIFFPNMLYGHILKQKNIHPCQEKEVNAGEDPKPSGSGTNSPQEITGDSSKRKK